MYLCALRFRVGRDNSLDRIFEILAPRCSKPDQRAPTQTPRGKHALQLDPGIVYLRFARREFCRRLRARGAVSRRSPRVPRARRAQRSKLTIINEKSRFVPLILCHRTRRCYARSIVTERCNFCTRRPT